MTDQKRQIGTYLAPTEWLCRELRRRIKDGTYPPNSFLPSERVLSASTHIGRAQVRNALAQLEKEGLLERTHGRGTRVLAPKSSEIQPRVAIVYTLPSSGGTGEQNYINEGIADQLNRLGVPYDRVLVHATPELPHAGPERLVAAEDLGKLTERYAGVIFNEANAPNTLQAVLDMEQARYPVMVANLERQAPVSGTRIDHATVMAHAVETLSQFGHQRIAYIGNPPEMLFYAQSVAGFRAGLEAAQHPADPSLIIFAQSSGALGGYQAMRRLLERSDPPTAVVAARDYFAAGIAEAMREANLELGRDISVIGFDDISWHTTDPVLTTFHEPCYELGTVAAEMLVDRITNGWQPVEQRILETKLILRRSVGPCPAMA